METENTIFAGRAIYHKIATKTGRWIRDVLYLAGVRIIEDTTLPIDSMITLDPNIAKIFENINKEKKK